MQRRLCRVVDWRKDIGHDSRETTNLNNGALCLDEKWGEGLAHAHDGEDVDLKCELKLIIVNLQTRDCVITSGIVNEKVEASAGPTGNILLGGLDVGILIDLKLERLDTYLRSCLHVYAS